jgi:FixJ family two-component response regulator
MIYTAGLVYVVDDDESVRRSLERLLGSIKLDVITFATADEFLQYQHPDQPSCLVLDIRMPGLSGLDLQQELSSVDMSIPVIIITGHVTVPLTVRAMKAGAIDLLQKPFDDQALLDSIHNALELDRNARNKRHEISQIQQHIESLTPREYEVFLRVIEGRLNKEIAHELGTCEKTIKVHRAHLMQKMQAKSLAMLVHYADKAGVVSDEIVLESK